mmetsp:Transcript_115105/g.229239  ORF Transcript_115105/g.229239 Transcript_115105/m.229239 type:complete len:318 (-) Transcript_115105:123-1076(-)
MTSSCSARENLSSSLSSAMIAPHASHRHERPFKDPLDAVTGARGEHRPSPHLGHLNALTASALCVHRSQLQKKPYPACSNSRRFHVGRYSRMYEIDTTSPTARSRWARITSLGGRLLGTSSRNAEDGEDWRAKAAWPLASGEHEEKALSTGVTTSLKALGIQECSAKLPILNSPARPCSDSWALAATIEKISLIASSVICARSSSRSCDHSVVAGPRQRSASPRKCRKSSQFGSSPSRSNANTITRLSWADTESENGVPSCALDAMTADSRVCRINSSISSGLAGDKKSGSSTRMASPCRIGRAARRYRPTSSRSST